MFVQREQCEIEGVPFELSVRPAASGYSGAWYCQICRRGAVKYDRTFSTPADAIEDARERARVHGQDHAPCSEACPPPRD
jgi:hypothetical protein